MFCDLCISCFDGIWDRDKTTRLVRRVRPNESSQRSNSPNEGGKDNLSENNDSLNEHISNSGDAPNHPTTPSISSSDSDSDWDTLDTNDDKEAEYNDISIGSSIRETYYSMNEYENTNHPFRYNFVHHTDPDSLKASVEQGCQICRPMHDHFGLNLSLRQHVSGYLTRFSIFCTRTLIGERVYSISFRLNAAYTHSNSRRFFCGLLVLEDDDPDLHVDLDERTDSPRTWNKVQNWIDDCMQSHFNCSNPLGFVPSRLLRLGGDMTFRLVDGKDCAPRTPYATLSYCWGPAPAATKFRLLERNLNSLREPQPIEALPLTFQHAFTVAKKLGMEYLWIDRLCILQDSQQDWQHEASQMHLVFKNCSFTISAHGSNDDLGGLFYSRDPKYVALSNMSVRLISPNIYETVALQEERYHDWAAEFQGSLMMERGWIMQERLLSPRTIYYGRNQVFWECNSRRCCEGRPDRAVLSRDLSPTELKPAAPPLWRQPLQGAMRGFSEDPVQQLFMDWESVVEEYSSCHLTFIDDKLVALSGLANDLRTKLLTFGTGYDTYVAGMWMNALPTSLMWEAEGRPYDTYIAPSWSWVSTDGKVSFRYKWMYRFRQARQTVLAEVISGKTTLVGNNDTGQVCGGELVVDGHLFTIKPSEIKELQRRELEMSLDIYCEALETKAIHGYLDNKDCRWDQFLCLPIQHNYESDKDIGYSIGYVDGLLLEQLEGGTMRRVGIFTCEVAEEWQGKGLLEQHSERRSITIV